MKRTAAAILAATIAWPPAVRGDAVRELPPLVVTAIRGSVLPERFAGHATVIAEDQITASRARSLGELLASEGGLRVTSATGDPARGTISLRGFGENAGARTLVLIDGRPVNRPDMGGANLQEIPLARVARVEILRGSQTARFGDQAVGGVVNIVTKQATGQPTTAAEFAAGSDEWLLGRVNHASGGKALAFTLDTEFNRTDGWRENSASEVMSLAAGWTGRLHPGAELTAGLAWTDQSGRFPGPLTTAQYENDPRQSIYAGRFASQFGSDQTIVRADLSARLEAGTVGEIEAPASWSSRELHWNMGPGYHTDNTLDTLTLAPVLRQAGSGWNAEQGVAFRYDRLAVVQYREMARLRPNGFSNLERSVTDLFAAGDWEPWDGWQLNAAARAGLADLSAVSRNLRRPADPLLNFNRSHSETNTACQLGIHWQTAPDTASWLRYDRLYRLPSIDEIASYQGFPLAEPFNDRLEAETGHNLELGGEWTPGRWRIKANVFLQALEGEIAYDYTRNLNVNLADTRRIGGELEVGYHADHWSASLAYSGVDARFTSGPYDGKHVYLVPAHQVLTTVQYQPWDPLAIRLEHQWQASCYEGNDLENSRPKLPAFQVFHLALQYRVTDNLTCYLRVSNLLDEHYATLKYSGLWYPAAGRQFQIGVRHVF